MTRSTAARAVVLAAALTASCYSPHNYSNCELRCQTPDDCTGLAGFEPSAGTAICDNQFCSLALPGTCGLGSGGSGSDLGSAMLGSGDAVIAAGDGFACAIDPNGQLTCWGDNASGVVSVGSDLVVPTPQVRASGVGSGVWSRVAAGGHTVCAMQGSDVYCWGANTQYQCGPNASDPVSPVITPVAVPPPPGDSWAKVAVGDLHACGLTVTGNISCWGDNGAGQVGTGNAGPSTGSLGSAVQQQGGPWVDVFAGPTMTCGVTGQGSSWGLFCWGDGDGTSGPERLGGAGNVARPSPSPVGVPSDSRPTKVVVGREAVCSLNAAHQLECWGHNANGAVGTGPGSSIGMPQLMRGADWADVATGGSITCGIELTGALSCWGTGAQGGLGTGVWSMTTTTPAATSVLTGAANIVVGDTGAPAPTIDQPRRVGADSELACATVDGVLTCWGGNRFGQLGDGQVGTAGTPQIIGSTPASVTMLVAGAHHECFVFDGEPHCWGATDHGEIDGATSSGTLDSPCTGSNACDVAKPAQFPLTLEASIAMAAGPDFTCSVGTNMVACWGANELAQLGGGSAGNHLRMFSFAATSIFASDGIGCVADGEGQASCWGRVFSQVSSQPLARTVLYDGLESLSYNDNTGVAVTNTHMRSQWTGSDDLSQFGDNSALKGGPNSVPQDAQLANRYANVQISSDTVQPFACGINLSGSISCWSVNAFGDIPGGSAFQALPTTPGFGSGCTQLTLGHFHGCALCGKDITCWGDNTYGQRGSDSSPGVVARVGGQAWMSVAATADGTCGVTANNVLACWGDGTHGELGNDGGAANFPGRQHVVPPAPAL